MQLTKPLEHMTGKQDAKALFFYFARNSFLFFLRKCFFFKKTGKQDTQALVQVVRALEVLCEHPESRTLALAPGRLYATY